MRCPNCGTEVPCYEHRAGPTVRKARSAEVGGCMFCTRHLGQNIVVAVVNGDHVEARFCRDCAKDVGLRWR